MKVSVAALSCLMLVAVLGSQARVTNDAETELMMSKLPLENPVVLNSFHFAADCCTSYISQSIPCSLMKSYFETSSECSKPGVIFLTKKGRQVCAKPSGPGVQDCMKKLKPYSI
ncbi:CCL15 isoform 2 [Pan troglodytes]|uniref:C-C motif chemokine n=3 Tax=Pan TaxID=9596 RepID=A0A6D2WSN0_PANTR|nr:C-C motif chemokine 15 isoform X1 [Pan troglodytes]XP_008969502.1 C-C motif chemokine 15 isoform X1 [Pan paniscus]XP_009430647.1 C-C motif chemokine 15 isoform X1 [Pan troglodytes]XP_009430648.1 C-C motif chemokine 15 isoform X1 [Pan troglodytes]PNI47454.1 CCL15 isoform 2 [Pan troglodytes]